MTDATPGRAQEEWRSDIDVARTAAARRVAEQAQSGGLTLGEHAERAAAIEQAATVEELDAAVVGLSDEGGGASGGRARWLIGVFWRDRAARPLAFEQSAESHRPPGRGQA